MRASIFYFCSLCLIFSLCFPVTLVIGQASCSNCPGAFCCSNINLRELSTIQCCRAMDGTTCDFLSGTCHDPDPDAEKKMTGIILGSVFGGIFGFLLLIFMCVYIDFCGKLFCDCEWDCDSCPDCCQPRRSYNAPAKRTIFHAPVVASIEFEGVGVKVKESTNNTNDAVKPKAGDIVECVENYYPSAETISSHIEIHRGDKLEIIEVADSLLLGSNIRTGAIGYFPITRVKCKQPGEEENLINIKPDEVAPPPAYNSDANTATGTVAAAPSLDSVYVGRAIALTDAESLARDELAFKQGDEILLLEADDEKQWWKGELNGKVGLFTKDKVRKR